MAVKLHPQNNIPNLKQTFHSMFKIKLKTLKTSILIEHVNFHQKSAPGCSGKVGTSCFILNIMLAMFFLSVILFREIKQWFFVLNCIIYYGMVVVPAVYPKQYMRFLYTLLYVRNLHCCHYLCCFLDYH